MAEAKSIGQSHAVARTAVSVCGAAQLLASSHLHLVILSGCARHRKRSNVRVSAVYPGKISLSFFTFQFPNSDDIYKAFAIFACTQA